MSNSKITNIIAKHLEEAITSDKSLIYEILVEGNKTEIDQAIKNAIHQSINNVLAQELKTTIKEIMLAYVSNNTCKIFKNYLDLNDIFNDVFKSALISILEEHVKLDFDIVVQNKEIKAKPKSKKLRNN